jgi:hypothetical protein
MQFTKPVGVLTGLILGIQCRAWDTVCSDLLEK